MVAGLYALAPPLIGRFAAAVGCRVSKNCILGDTALFVRAAVALLAMHVVVSVFDAAVIST
jgi:hypothetical protein